MVCHHYTMHTNQHSSGVYGNVGYPCSDTIHQLASIKATKYGLLQ